MTFVFLLAERNLRMTVTLYVFEKARFANDIERFWNKVHGERNVKIANCLRALARAFAI
jgi:hypothetical protein